MDLESFEVVRDLQEGTTPPESVTTSVIDDLTKMYDNEEADNDSDSDEIPPSTTEIETKNDDDLQPPPNFTEEIDHSSNLTNEQKEDFDNDEMMTTLKSTINQQTSLATMLRDRTTLTNTHLTNLTSLLSSTISKPPPTSSPTTSTPLITPRVLITATLLAFFLAFGLFLIHTLIFSQIISSQQSHHLNVTNADRVERLHHIDVRDELRDELMHKAYERARESEEEIKLCRTEISNSHLELTKCFEERRALEQSLGEMRAKGGDVKGKVDELRKKLIIVRQENDKLKGCLILGGIVLATWAAVKIFGPNKM